jgi:DNA-binding response OmpR family regulator
MKNRVLYIEDDTSMAKLVTEGLTRSGYNVLWLANGNGVSNQFLAFLPDICILDIMMPGLDGYAVAGQLRILDNNVPLIFLSARSLPQDVVKGFKSGGDDYIRKPFSMDELLVRIETLITRRTKTNNSRNPVYEFGNCILKTASQQLTTTSGQYALSFRESLLLEMLLEKRNEVLKRRTALLHIWGDDNFYNTRSMDVFVYNLRGYFRQDTNIEIINVRGVGFKIVTEN